MWPFFLAALAVAACTVPDVPCVNNDNCDLFAGGVCASQSGGGVSWCSYPDDACPSGYRYSTEHVPSTTSGHCVAVGVNTGGNEDGGMTGGVGISCLDLRATCGPDGNDTCCHVLPVPSGEYFRSFDAVNDAASGAQTAPAMISGFQLDKYEVTVGRFRRFLALEAGTQANHPAGGEGAHAKITGSGWQAGWNQHLEPTSSDLTPLLHCDPVAATWTDMPGGSGGHDQGPSENRPINCVTWYEAFAFCIWDGGYLPTEAEWNYAAAGGDQQRAYAWSSPAASLTLDNTYASFNCLEDGASGCALQDIANVGNLPNGNGRWGHSDLTGNVLEWALDIFAPYSSQCSDCATIDGAANERVARGGSYATDPTQVRTTARLRTGFRAQVLPASRVPSVGIRCARPM